MGLEGEVPTELRFARTPHAFFANARRHKPLIAKTVDEAVSLAHPLSTPKATLAEVTRALHAFRG